MGTHGGISNAIAMGANGQTVHLDYVVEGTESSIGLTCSFCGQPMHLRNGPVRAPGFAHNPEGCIDRLSPDGRLHIAAQVLIASGAPFWVPAFDRASASGPTSLKEAVLERLVIDGEEMAGRVIGFRPDVCGILPSGVPVIVEVQVTHATSPVGLERRSRFAMPCLEIDLLRLKNRNWNEDDVREALLEEGHSVWQPFPVGALFEQGVWSATIERRTVQGYVVRTSGIPPLQFRNLMLGCRAGENAGEWILAHEFGERAIGGLIGLGGMLFGDRTLAVEKVRDEMRRARTTSSQPQFDLVGGTGHRNSKGRSKPLQSACTGIQLSLL